MADFGVLVDQLRAEARVADTKGEGAAAERLRELADDTGEMTGEQREWLERANEDEVRGFVRRARLRPQLAAPRTRPPPIPLEAGAAKAPVPRESGEVGR